MSAADENSSRMCKASDFAPGDIGSLTWIHDHGLVEVRDNGHCAQWKHLLPDGRKLSWVPLTSNARLHSGTYSWDFNIAGMGDRQIGVGCGLLFSGHRLDWGFFGYLGASRTAVSYDPSTGDVVTATESIQGNLPTFRDSGTVSVHATLPRNEPGKMKFIVSGIESNELKLPGGAVICPAACFLELGQTVTIANLKKH